MRKFTPFLRPKIHVQFFRDASTSYKQSSAEYCMDLVRKSDYENFLCTLLLTNNIVPAAFAVRAFNIEIAQIQDQVHENNIGIMRFKFWEDSLNKIYDGVPPRSPIALELHRVLQRYKLSKRYFKRLIHSRAERMGLSTFADLESLEKYSENTVSSIYYLLLEANGIQNIHADHAASHLGKAHGIVTLLRSIPHNAQRRVIVLPRDILMKHNVSEENIFRGKSGQDLSNTIFDVASQAKQHLDKARKLKSDVPKDAKLIFLPATCIDIYLEKLQKVDFNVFDPSLYVRNNLLPLHLLRRKLFSSNY
ncbi:NADH dehydrogenase (ubiquinone) complex I, assembly factor 6 [Cephus cinctus]|uniref:15-cis-phytoene synthase n=1 Tax=Cephus cinctus TaxID=211228 RepID=A0AAJ7FU67_CEPCN|nr:NADH dehydrogenase (ubiquinone) complex I, assembly factor 6 [Cephus cinctus]